MEITRECSRCHLPRTRDEWPPSGWQRGGWCRPCRNEYAAQRNVDMKAQQEKLRRESGTKTCTRCHTVRPRTEFYFSRGYIQGVCKECRRLQHLQDYVPKSEYDDIPRPCVTCGVTYRPKTRRPSKYCSRKCGERARRESGRERESYLTRKYGITQSRYDEILSAQGGGCALCGNGPTERGRFRTYLHIDHDHRTGAVRGLLCDKCNLLLGQFGDDPARLMAAVTYLIHPPTMQIG